MAKDKEDNTKLSMNEKLDKLLMYFESGLKDMKKKEFKLPFRARAIAKNYHKRNKILVLLITKNWTITPIVGVMLHGMLKIKDNWHTIPLDCVVHWKGKIPTVILPEWQITPTKLDALDIKELENQSQKNKNIIDPQTYAIRALKLEGSLLGKKLSGKSVIWIIIGAVIIGYLIFGGGFGG